MKQKEFSPMKFIFHWLLIYVIVLAFGIILSLVVTAIYYKNTENIAKFDMECYLETGDFNPNVAIHGANNYVYDAAGQRIRGFPSDDLNPYWDDYVNKLFSEIHEKNGIYKLTFNPDPKSPFAIFAAYPLPDGGVFLFFRDPPFLYKTLLIVFVTITLLIILMAIYTYLIFRMEQKTLKMQKDYVDNISHELKSPIASVRALTETMYDGLIQNDEKRRQYYKIILQEINGLEHTVSNMLELSHIQNNQTDCSRTTLSMREVFGEIIEKYSILCESRNLSFAIYPDTDGQTMLYTNKALASRLLDILLDNAVKFAGKDGSVAISIVDEPWQLTFTVKDSGTGISPDDQPHIFGRFYKGDKGHNEKGSGLGLSIALEIANSLDERLWLKSTGREGTEFSFTIHKN